MKYTRLGDLLVDACVISDAQLGQALADQKKTGQRLGETLVSEGIITEHQLVNALTMQLGIDFIDLTNVEIDPEMTKYVPRNLAKKYSIVPVRSRGDELYLAMSDPLNFIAMEEAKTASKRRIVPMIATQSAVEHAISALYGTEGAKRAVREMQQEMAREGSSGTVVAQATELAEDAGAAPSVRLVNNIIERGISDRASDIHIEPQAARVLVRMRIDGVLHNEFDIPKELQASLTSRIKVMCGMDVTERRVPQDGRAVVRVRMQEVDLRVSTLPTINGEKIVIRLLSRDTNLDTAEELGFYGRNLELYRAFMKHNQGIVLVVGPTGSGKSSTLYTMISLRNTEGVNIVTLEDPVEYNIVGVNQVQVEEKTGMTFASGLRSILRQDPDIISVGEIRDGETAEIALRAAVTGHLVLSTIHTNDAVSTLDRLSDIGVEPYMMASALKGVIAQRLVRRICPHCKEAYTPTPEEMTSIGLDPARAASTKLYRGRGCPDCFGTGYRGRTVVAETLEITPAIAQAIRTRAGQEAVQAAVRASGFVPMAANCRELVLSGVSTVEEVLRSAYTAD